MSGYGVILADPPWDYNNTGVEGAAQRQYPTMTPDQICALPVADYAAPDSVLLLWATWPRLDVALRVVSAWGFEYVTGMPWVKITGEPQRSLWGDLDIHAQYGIGFWVRGATEPLLIARRGNAKAPSTGFVGLLCRNLRHSRKPDNVYQYAEAMPGPYLELFARRKRGGGGTCLVTK